MKCFIACAFGKSDVDQIYSELISPIFKENKIVPLRVDKIEFNSNIDQKILELIAQCDFGLADLTYARPSVYYEAGWIEGLGKQVIYMARSDHFRPQPEDLYGNHRVHFDLLTRNIIPWSKINRTLIQKFEGRLRVTIKPILKELSKQNKLQDARASFSMKSVSERCLICSLATTEILSRKRFRDEYYQFRPNLKSYRRAQTRIVVCISDSFTQQDISLIYNRHRYATEEEHKCSQIILVSLNSVPKSRIDKALPFSRQIDTHLYIEESPTEGSFYICFFSNIRSAFELELIEEYISKTGLYGRTAAK